ncbi:SIMPL domain-containing protein [Tianweitania sp. BSSL-BM11]|uniref:SIMPL domain-containing protein n=2 Tax=Tianweitania aestuarii TaxID=2814886 RepID=A0ABS5RUC7_9HYPH|nr:SIMPL domain-containing protein [Tianweitania aestuarii]
MRATLPLAFLMLGSVSAYAQPVQTAPTPQIVVTGEGEATARPDLAMLSLSVMREAKTAREALDANSSAMAAVISAMKAEGIADADLQTSSLSIEPRYVYPANKDGEQQEPKLVGYQVTNSLGVRVRQIDKVGALLDKAVSLGVNQGGQINFDSADTTKVVSEARKRAVQDAMERAKTLAEAAGIKLGQVTEISESNLRQPPVPMMMAKSMEARPAPQAVPVEAGENVYRVEVSVTFAIDR